MYITADKNRLAKMDKENLQLKTDKWKQESPNDFFYYRSYGAVITDDGENGQDKGKDEDECVIKVSTLTIFSRKRKQLPTQNMRLLRHGLKMLQLRSGEKEIKFCFAKCFSSDISQTTQKIPKLTAAEIQIKTNSAICASYTEALKI